MFYTIVNEWPVQNSVDILMNILLSWLLLNLIPQVQISQVLLLNISSLVELICVHTVLNELICVHTVLNELICVHTVLNKLICVHTVLN
jgi:hypothetical protein